MIIRSEGERFAWTLVAPTAAMMLAILGLPLMFSLFVSFHDWDLTRIPNRLEWAGLQNYVELVAGIETWRALQFTLIYTVACVGGEFVLGLVLALLLHHAPVGRQMFTAILVLPMMMTPIVSGLVWRLMYNPTYGVINQSLGLGNVLWLGEVDSAVLAVIIATIWQNTGFVMILLLAGLQSLSKEPFEAARIDGASAWQSFRYVMLPLLAPTILVVLLIRTIFEFRAFDVIWILTQGGPAGATEALSLLNFRMGFRYFAIGPAAALSWIMLAATAVLSVGYIRALGRAR
ncbi:MAG: sugar ABC transporter permease [Proteobacteria bacterium]|nr:sugar ABC transporter permease [Pseudomonadota bacterium]MBI3495861.1 sugar ABC transporter permease [Pseudomonadota bacterium]